MLLKVSAPAASRGAVIELVQVFRAKVVDVADEALTLEVVGDPGKLVALERVDGPLRHSRDRPHRQGGPGAGLRREHRNAQGVSQPKPGASLSYCVIAALVMRSPCWIASTTSMPSTTRPKTA